MAKMQTYKIRRGNSMKALLKRTGGIVLSGMMVFVMCGFTMEEQDLNVAEEVITKPYVYEVLPGTTEWVEMTPDERFESCYISEEVVSRMTTEALVETVLNYPYFTNVYAYDSFDYGIEVVSEYCPALKELLSRAEAAEALQNYLDNHTATSTAEERLVTKAAKMLAEKVNCSEDEIEMQENVLIPYSSSVQTPNGTNVTVSSNRSWTWWKNYNGMDYATALDACDVYLARYPGIVMIREPYPYYNCHSYAWYSTSSTNPYWMEDPSPYMEDGSYARSFSKKGNKITYKRSGTYEHSGILTSNSDQVTSKWGNLGLFRHDKYDCPYSTGGVTYEYWEAS